MRHPPTRSPRECGETPQHHLTVRPGTAAPGHAQLPRPEGPGPLTPPLLPGGPA